MKDTLISFQTAKLAEEKGFDLSGYLRYDDNIPLRMQSNYNPSAHQMWYLDVSQTRLQKWLREKYNCIVEVIFHFGKETVFHFGKETDRKIVYHSTVDYYGKDMEIPLTIDNDFESELYPTYEEALEVGLLEALKLIKQK